MPHASGALTDHATLSYITGDFRLNTFNHDLMAQARQIAEMRARVQVPLDTIGLRHQLDAVATVAQSVRLMYEQVSSVADQLAQISRAGLDAAACIDFVAIQQAAVHALNRETRLAFTCAGFVPSPHVDPELGQRVLAARLAGGNRRVIQGIVLDHYDAHNAQAVGEIVARLRKNELFVGRGAVLGQTLNAHRAKRYDSMTTYGVAAMIEGVTMPLVHRVWPYWEEDDDGRKKGKGRQPAHKHMPKILRDSLAVVRYSASVDGAWALIDYMESHLFKPFDLQAPGQPSRRACDLNRHALLHGYAYGGSRLNTLRCFLMLDLLGILIPYVNREIEPFLFAPHDTE